MVTTVEKKALQSGKGGRYDRVEFSLDKYIFPYLGKRKLIDITTEDLQLFINEYSKSYSASSTQKVLTPLKNIFKYAYNNGHVSVNPTLLLQSINDENYGKKTKVTRSLRKDELEEFEQLCKLKCKNGNYKYHLGFVYILILNTGIRRGEAAALRWSDVDLDKKTLYVHNAVVRHKTKNNHYEEVIEQPKTKHGERVIPLNNKAMDALFHIKEIHPSTEWIISTMKGNRVCLTNIKDDLSNMLIKNYMKPFGLHVLRHTFATRLYQNGASIDVISKLMGHSSVRNTYRYIHVDTFELHAAMAKAILYNSDIILN